MRAARPEGDAKRWILGTALALLVLGGLLFVLNGGSDPEIEDFRPRVSDHRPPPTDPGLGAWSSKREGEARTVHLRKGFEMPLYERPGGRVIGRAGPRTRFGSRSVFWVAKRGGRGGRWLGVPSPARLDGELSWIRLDPERQRFGTTPYRLRVSLAARRVELLRRGRLIHRATVTIGRAGVETPTGRFAVTDTIRQGLLPVYGCCAIALSARQPNTPPEWPGGDRIAIHGTTGPVGDAASYGCLRATDADMRELMRRVQPGVPAVISA